MATFGKIFRQLREEKGFSQEKIADMLRVSKSTVSMWEIDKRSAQRSTMEEICDIFNVDMDYLCGRTDVRRRVSFDNDGNTYINAPEYSPEMIEMIYLFSKLSDDQKKSIITMMRSFVQ